MDIKNVSENQKEAFNKVAEHPLQSWEWGEFRKASGNKIVRLGVFKKGKLADALQVTIHQIPFTKYRIGALIKGPAPTQIILDALKDLAKKENLIFIKMEPNVPTSINHTPLTISHSDKSIIRNEQTEEFIKLLKDNNCVSGKTLFTPTTFWIDLTPSEEELIKSFHPKTRYNIRLAQKKGVTVVENNSDEAFEKYLKLTRETVERQGFYSHTEKYHRLMWQILHTNMVKDNKKPIAHLLTAHIDGEIVTTWILIAWHQFLYYPYGASSVKFKEVMANNLMMLEAIRFGKKLGLKTFDLWGREEGKGFTKFKEGYNPKIVELLGTWDLPTSTLYPLYIKAETLRWKLLRLRTRVTFSKPTF